MSVVRIGRFCQVVVQSFRCRRAALADPACGRDPGLAEGTTCGDAGGSRAHFPGFFLPRLGPFGHEFPRFHAAGQHIFRGFFCIRSLSGPIPLRCSPGVGRLSGRSADPAPGQCRRSRGRVGLSGSAPQQLRWVNHVHRYVPFLSKRARTAVAGPHGPAERFSVI